MFSGYARVKNKSDRRTDAISAFNFCSHPHDFKPQSLSGMALKIWEICFQISEIRNIGKFQYLLEIEPSKMEF
jgi:hypothetical protein